MVGHVFLYNAGVRRVKQLLDGRVYYVSMVRRNLGPIRTDVNAAWDLASHDISGRRRCHGEAHADVVAPRLAGMATSAQRSLAERCYPLGKVCGEFGSSLPAHLAWTVWALPSFKGAGVGIVNPW